MFFNRLFPLVLCGPEVAQLFNRDSCGKEKKDRITVVDKILRGPGYAPVGPYELALRIAASAG